MEKYGDILLCKPGGNILGSIAYRPETVKLKQSLTNIWELTFEVDEYINEEKTAWYDEIVERMELLLTDNRNNKKYRFIINQQPTEALSSTDGTSVKTINAGSIECDLQTKFLRKFKVNCGTTDSLEYLIYEKNSDGSLNYNRNLNAYSVNPSVTDSRKAIDYIAVDCRLDKVCQNFIDRINEIKENDLTLSAIGDTWVVNKNTTSYKYVKELVQSIPRIQKHLTYDTNDSEILTCYVYSGEDETYAIARNSTNDSKTKSISDLKEGIELIRDFYINYKDQLSLFSLALENGVEGNWKPDTDNISDDLASSRWNFDVDNVDVYSFLTNTFANYAHVIISFDKYNKKVGARYITELESNEFDTGVVINMRNLANEVEINSTSEDGIKTKLYVGDDKLGIENANYTNYIMNLDYFMDSKTKYNEYVYVDESLHNAYHNWKNVCDTNLNNYIQLSKNYNQTTIDANEIRYRLPNDGASTDYTTFEYDKLILVWLAYTNAISSYETMYMSDYCTKKVYWKTPLFKQYPYKDEETSFDNNPSSDPDIPNIEDTIYWHDWYTFKYSIMPQIYESLKRRVSTEEYDGLEVLLMKDKTRILLANDAFRWGKGYDTDDFDYLKDGNPKYLKSTDDDFLKTIDDWIYEWSLYGRDEIQTKYEAWNTASNVIKSDTFFVKENNEIKTETLYFYYGDGNKIIYSTTEDVTKELITSLVVNKVRAAGSTLLDSDMETFQNEELSYSVTGWTDVFNQYRDYWAYDTRTYDTRNKMTNRYEGFEGLGVCIQTQVMLAIRNAEMSRCETLGQTYKTQQEALQKQCSYDTCDYFTDEQRKIINQLISTTTYTNENITGLYSNRDDIVTRIDIQKELLDDAKVKLSELSQPQYGFTVSLENLFALEEFKPMWKGVDIGNYIYLDTDLYEDDYKKVRVISIEKNPIIDDNELTLEFSSMTKSLNGISDLAFILEGMASGSTGGTSSSGSGTGSGTYGTNEAEIQLSNNMLNALLTNNSIKTATANAVIDTLQADSGAFKSLFANSGVFDSLKVGNTAVSGDCITAGTIQSVAMNGGEPVSQFNLNDGTFSYGNGGLIYDGENLSINGEIAAESGMIGGWYITENGISSKNGNSLISTFSDEDEEELTPLAYLVPDELYLGDEKGEIFKVNKDGVVVNNGNFSGDIVADNITLNNGLNVKDKFIVDANGNMSANNAVLTNSIVAAMNDGSEERKLLGDFNFRTEDGYKTTSFTIGDFDSTKHSSSEKLGQITIGYNYPSYSGGYINYKGQHHTFNGDISCDSGISCKSVSLPNSNINFKDNYVQFNNNSGGGFEFNNGGDMIYFRGLMNNPVRKINSKTPVSIYVDANGELGYYSSSSRRFKQDISYDITDFNPEKLYNLKPAQFRYNAENGGGDDSELLLGFIAEDVYEIHPQAAIMGGKDIVNNWEPRELIAPMLALIQKQHEEIEQLKQEIKEIKEKL